MTLRSPDFCAWKAEPLKERRPRSRVMIVSVRARLTGKEADAMTATVDEPLPMSGICLRPMNRP